MPIKEMIIDVEPTPTPDPYKQERKTSTAKMEPKNKQEEGGRERECRSIWEFIKHIIPLLIWDVRSTCLNA